MVIFLKGRLPVFHRTLSLRVKKKTLNVFQWYNRSFPRHSGVEENDGGMSGPEKGTDEKSEGTRRRKVQGTV